MTSLATEAVVLHAFDYLETSRILRLATREAGVQSVLARGARRPRSRFGTALDLFAGGTAFLAMRPGRDLQTLTGFDVTRARQALAGELERFTGAAALAELTLRFAGEAAHPELFDAVSSALDAIAAAPPDAAAAATLAGAWRLLAEMGFAPQLDACSVCHDAVDPGIEVAFHHRSGGAVCDRCARERPGGRRLPANARATLGAWLTGNAATVPPVPDTRAHQRLLREFVHEHLAEGRSLPAFEVWERAEWSGNLPAHA
jgi:DNA repair protein RecO (recombination protein O)